MIPNHIFMSTEFCMKLNQLTWVVASVVAFVGSNAVAQTKPDGMWHGTGGLGLSSSSGNGSSTSLSLTANLAKETSTDKATVYGAILNGRSKSGNVTTKSADLARLGGRYDFNLSPQLYGFAGGELEKDGIQNLSLRATVNGGLGYKVIRNETTAFDVFGGLGYSRYDYKAPLADKSGAELILGEESSHKLSSTTTFKQRFVVYPSFKSANGYRATFDAGVAVALSGNLQATVNLASTFNSKVSAGVDKASTLLLVGVAYKF
jgi:putative salt-induced outer membrane protein